MHASIDSIGPSIASLFPFFPKRHPYQPTFSCQSLLALISEPSFISIQPCKPWPSPNGANTTWPWTFARNACKRKHLFETFWKLPTKIHHPPRPAWPIIGNCATKILGPIDGCCHSPPRGRVHSRVTMSKCCGEGTLRWCLHPRAGRQRKLPLSCATFLV